LLPDVVHDVVGPGEFAVGQGAEGGVGRGEGEGVPEAGDEALEEVQGLGAVVELLRWIGRGKGRVVGGGVEGGEAVEGEGAEGEGGKEGEVGEDGGVDEGLLLLVEGFRQRCSWRHRGFEASELDHCEKFLAREGKHVASDDNGIVAPDLSGPTTGRGEPEDGADVSEFAHNLDENFGGEVGKACFRITSITRRTDLTGHLRKSFGTWRIARQAIARRSYIYIYIIKLKFYIVTHSKEILKTCSLMAGGSSAYKAGNLRGVYPYERDRRRRVPRDRTQITTTKISNGSSSRSSSSSNNVKANASNTWSSCFLILP
jgi:hypothetical protein